MVSLFIVLISSPSFFPGGRLHDSVSGRFPGPWFYTHCQGDAKTPQSKAAEPGQGAENGDDYLPWRLLPEILCQFVPFCVSISENSFFSAGSYLFVSLCILLFLKYQTPRKQRWLPSPPQPGDLM